MHYNAGYGKSNTSCHLPGQGWWTCRNSYNLCGICHTLGLMRHTYSGSCQCQAVRYLIKGDSVNLFVCHCTECQRQSASAFGMALWVSDYEIVGLSGELTAWSRQTVNGQTISGEFCSVCGTRMFHRPSANDKVISIKPGTLDNARRLKPVAHIWTSEAHDWVQIPEGCLCYEENPPGFDEMMDAWHQAHATD